MHSILSWQMATRGNRDEWRVRAAAKCAPLVFSASTWPGLKAGTGFALFMRHAFDSFMQWQVTTILSILHETKTEMHGHSSTYVSILSARSHHVDMAI